MKKTLILLSAGLACFSVSAQTLNWQIAVPKSIEVNSTTRAWHTGRVQDVIDFKDGSVMVGANTGGVWWVGKDGSSRCLTNNWDDPDITCVERGCDGEFNVYAATAAKLFENLSGQLNAWQDIPLPPAITGIKDIRIFKGARKIVIADLRGIWYSSVPAPGTPRSYNWQQAPGVTAGDLYFSLSGYAEGFAWETTAPITSPVTATTAFTTVNRSPVHSDIFWVEPGGTVKSAYRLDGGAVGTTTISSPGAATANASIATVARKENQLDVFYHGADGEIKTTWWNTDDGNWVGHNYTMLVNNAGNASFLANPGTPMTAVSRDPSNIELFWVNRSNAIVHTSWNNAGGWTMPSIVPGSNTATGSNIAAVVRDARQLDIFWIDPGGNIKSSRKQMNISNPWITAFTIPGTGIASVGAGIAAVARDPGKLDILWVSSNGRLMTSWWDGGSTDNWNNHAYALTSTNTASTQKKVALITRNPLHLDAFWLAADGSLRTNWWDVNSTASFGTQTLTLENNISNFAVSSAYDEELNLTCISNTNTFFHKRWKATGGVVLAGKAGNSTNCIARGTFRGNTLTFSATTITGTDGDYSSTSIATSKYGGTSYAVVCNGGTDVTRFVIKYILKSTDGGQTWATAGTAVENLPASGTQPGCFQLGACSGSRGVDWNNTIAVSPVNNDALYVGWITLFCSTNGSRTWRFISSEHVHADIPAVRFSEYDKTGKTAYFCTDGGLSATFDLNSTFFSGFNENLPVLQAYTTDPMRQTEGTLGVSYQVNNLIGMGLQDNGNVWALHGSTAWKRSLYGDGAYFVFTRDRQSIQRMGIQESSNLQRFEWDGTTFVNRGDIPVDPDHLKPGTNPPRTIDNGAFAIVNSPVSWDAAGAKIYGYAWVGRDLYSFWCPSGTKSWRFEYETTLRNMSVDETITTAGSASGLIAFFATSSGRIIQYTRQTRTAVPMIVNNGSLMYADLYGINRLCILSDNSAFALLNGWRGEESKGYILRLEAGTWTRQDLTLVSGITPPPQRLWAIEADWTATPPALLACTDNKVYRSANLGQRWEEASAGLPARAHLADIRFVIFPNGTRRWYISTYGRSVWYADVR